MNLHNVFILANIGMVFSTTYFIEEIFNFYHAAFIWWINCTESFELVLLNFYLSHKNRKVNNRIIKYLYDIIYIYVLFVELLTDRRTKKIIHWNFSCLSSIAASKFTKLFSCRQTVISND